MSKKGDSAGKTTKTTNPNAEQFKGRIFSCDLDDAAFEPFFKYRRQGVRAPRPDFGGHRGANRQW